MKKAYLMLALLALFLQGCTSHYETDPEEAGYEILASNLCPQWGVEGMFFIPTWQLAAMGAILASASLLAILYMVNRFFGNEAGQAMVKIELFELFATMFIVVVVIALLNSACGIQVGTIIAPPDYAHLNLFDASAAVLTEFSGDLVYAATFLHTVYIPLDFMSTTTLTQRPLGMGTEYQPLGGLGAVMKPAVVNSLQMISVAFIMVRAQLMVLDFVTFAMLTYYLPLGILMRTFTPTRRIGGTLIGLTLGLVLVFPYLIVLNGFTVFSMNPFDMEEYIGVLGEIVEAAWQPMKEFWSGSLSLFEPLNFLTMLKYLFTGLFGSIVGLYYSLVLRTAAVAFLIGLFFPALNTLILVTTIRYLTKAFGEEIDVSNLTRMI